MENVDYDPRSLPSATSVVIVDLRRVDANRVTEFMRCSYNAPAFVCDEITTDTIVEIWRALPPGDMVRCHTPPIGLRFYVNLELVCEASICWACENIFGTALSTEFCYTFDPQSAAARELLNVVQSRVSFKVMANQESD